MKVALYGNSKPEITEQIRNRVMQMQGVTLVEGDADVDMALSIGGDGTFLRTAAAIGNTGVPILGINAGHLGFLADVPLTEVEDALTSILVNKKYEVEHRSLLHLDILNCQQPYQQNALNEVAILKRDQSSMVSVSVFVDGSFLNQYDADGLAIATATGSTAYAMSAGGPILEPQSNCWVIVPIAPHSLTTRPLVIRDSCELDIQVESRNNIYLVATDGKPVHLTTQSKLHLSKADYQIGVVRRPDHTFFDTLRTKLMWGRDGRYL